MFSHLRVAHLLLGAFGLVLALVALMAGASIWKMGVLNDNTEYFAVNLVPSYKSLHQAALELSAIRRNEFRHVLADTDAHMDDLESKISAGRQRIRALVADYEKNLISDAEDRKHLETVSALLARYEATWEPVRQLSRRTPTDASAGAKATAALGGDSQAAYDAVQDAVDAWWNYNLKLADDETASSRATYGAARLTMLALLLVSIVVGGICSALIVRTLTSALGAEPAQLGAVARRVADGDLSPVDGLSGAPAASVLASLGAMQQGLAGIVGQVRSSSDNIATGSAQIATGNADLSQRTEEQASNLQQTTASMMEIRSTVQKNSETAEQANRLASSTSQAAQQGGEVMNQVITTMQDIAASSRKITDIISVIDGIAFQTNILALNAAVEAARAGEQGRGFAVVASEVRALAQRSAEAAKEIKSLIASSVEKVEGGSRLVENAGASMEGIVTQVRKVADFITEISATATEQATSIGQVTDAVGQLDQVTQQNAALVEEGAAAAESLRHQAEMLTSLVSRFRGVEATA